MGLFAKFEKRSLAVFNRTVVMKGVSNLEFFAKALKHIFCIPPPTYTFIVAATNVCYEEYLWP